MAIYKSFENKVLDAAGRERLRHRGLLVRCLRGVISCERARRSSSMVVPVVYPRVVDVMSLSGLGDGEPGRAVHAVLW